MDRTPDEPLTLTVHSLPSPGEAGAQALASTRMGRWKMLGLLLVCATPVIASYFTYYVIRPEGRTNYGELVTPQRPLPVWTGLDAQGQAVPLNTLKDQWLLISVADSSCPQVCQEHLYLQRQLRETLGREKDRVDWVWLRTGESEVAPALQKATAAAVVLKVDAQAVADWLQPAPGQKIEDHLYVVDPLGNWMMRFPAQLDPSRAKRDLERLLRASSSWDRSGSGH
ncbi:hypothetical protein [Hydrogenophaga sp.]|uniref:SCO family protein n=1 Tax=Hydrogenophaga sp. TaxID=1904254 RepID=UPI002628E842|nr:hypothetical protein [Hydrogenophaga sp.]